MAASEVKSMKENTEPYRRTNGGSEHYAKQRAILVEWLNSIQPNLALPTHASDEAIRSCLLDGTVLCSILKKLRPGNQGHEPDISLVPQSERVKKFIIALDEMGISRFELADLEKGPMKPVIECLLSIRTRLLPNTMEERRKILSQSKLERPMQSPIMSAAWSPPVSPRFHEVLHLKQGSYADIPPAKIAEIIKSNSIDNAPTQSLLSVVDGILDESVERKNGEIPHRVACLLRKVVQEIERRISTQKEHLKTQNNLIKARDEKYQSRIKVLEALAADGACEEPEVATARLHRTKVHENNKVNETRFDDEEVSKLKTERDRIGKEVTTLKKEMEEMKKKHEIHCSQLESEAKEAKAALKERIMEFDRRSANSNNNANTDLEEKIKELEHKLENSRSMSNEGALEERIKELEQQQDNLSSKERAVLEERIKELEQKQDYLSSKERESLEERIKELEQQHDYLGSKERSSVERMKELELEKADLSKIRTELELQLEESIKEKTALGEKLKLELQETDLSNKSRMALEEKTKELERQLAESRDSRNKIKNGLQEKIKGLERHLIELINQMKELEEFSESRNQRWIKKVNRYKSCVDFQFNTLKDLKSSSASIKQEVLKTQSVYSEGFNQIGVRIRSLAEAAESYHVVLTENRRLFNEVQDLKGNIRVYCRIRPFLPGQKGNDTFVERVNGEDGELVVANPSKSGKDGQRMFKFNKVFGPESSQADVYSNIQPFVRSVVDGYHVCIFAYGQTGSGKTYTMTGPNNATEATWGVNYRALNDLFRIAETRKGTMTYEVTVQMVEIYNEQVRDLLCDGAQKKIGIVNASQGGGLTVPDASIQTVGTTSDVLSLMEIGFKNRAVTATAMNERSSRSHSVLIVHVRCTELKTGNNLRGSLSLVDLAGSERVDRSEVTGVGLKEAQHINKSLSALGDVIFSLSLKNSHVPYRNSKLTQLLQSSLGGQAKTLMFVQLNPDVSSYSESLSTLKFAERVSGVELGAAKSSKEKDVNKELVEQVNSLRDTLAKREEEIERLLQNRRSGEEFDDDASSAEVDSSNEAPVSPEGSDEPPERTKATVKFARPALKPVQSPSITTPSSPRDSPKPPSSPSATKKSPNQSFLKPTGRRNWN